MSCGNSGDCLFFNEADVNDCTKLIYCFEGVFNYLWPTKLTETFKNIILVSNRSHKHSKFNVKRCKTADKQLCEK